MERVRMYDLSRGRKKGKCIVTEWVSSFREKTELKIYI